MSVDVFKLIAALRAGPVTVSHAELRAMALAADLEPTENRPALVAMARDKWEESGQIEIDDDALISEGEDPGFYVQAWLWVEKEEEN